MSSATGGGSKGGSGDFNYGVSPFDIQSVMNAVGTNEEAINNRYQQLGLGGSTMQGQDIEGAKEQGEATIGQLQTQNVGNSGLNPALQSNASSSALGTSLTNLATQAGNQSSYSAGAASV